MKNYLLLFLLITTTLCRAQTPILWGFTVGGGTNTIGTIFNYNVATGIETDKHNFAGSPGDGRSPFATLTKAYNGLLYGMTSEGGPYSGGTIFSYNISAGAETDIYNFGNGSDGSFPFGFLAQASDSLLYGMTKTGGANEGGTFFSYNVATGIKTDLHDFGSGTDGKFPVGSLLQASNGLIYGVVSQGGTYNHGIIFSYIISNGTYSILHNFGNGTDGVYPDGSLIQASDSLLYGMTVEGGTNNDGTIFNYSISTGSYSILHNFKNTDGSYPQYEKLLQVNDSLLYGLTQDGGTVNYGGVLFSYNILTGTETVLHNFGVGTDGQGPQASLMRASNGLLYGNTTIGGVNNEGIIFSYDITTGMETDVHDFGGGTDGGDPINSLIEVDSGTISVTPVTAICAGGSTTLVANGSTTYTWAPATGLSATTGDTVIANPTVTTIYTVTGTGGIPTYPTTVTVTVIPVPSVSVNTPSPVCSGTGATLTANGAASYTWSPSTNLSSTTDSIVTATPTATTTYTVIGSNSGCTDTATTIVSVNPNPVLNAPTPPTLCNGSIATLTVSGAKTYTWSPVIGLSATTGDTIVANPTITTTYTVSGVNINGCTNTTTVTVNVSPSLVLAVNTPQPKCIGNSDTLIVTGATNYTWSPATGLSGTTGSTVIASPIATTTYTISGTSLSGCTGNTVVMVAVKPNPPLIINTPSPICNGEKTTLTISGATTYIWSPATGLNTTTGDSVIASPTATTVYTITATTNSCTATATDTVSIISAPPLDIVPPSAIICTGLSATLTISGGGSDFVWSPSISLSDSTGSIVVATPSVTTTYTVTGIDSLGCAATGTDEVIVVASPNQPTFHQHGDTLISSSTKDNQWYRNGVLLSDTGQYLVITDTGEYWVIVANEANGCSAASDSMDITVVTGVNQLSVNSNQLSVYPNPTGGEITIVSSKIIDDLKVTNLLGQLVYESQPKQTQFTFELNDEGMYFVTVTTDSEISTSKIIVSK